MEETGVLNVYKCPSCGGAVRFDAHAGALACMWCGCEYEAEGLEVKQVNSSLQGYLCPECGAQLMADDYIVADTCPYCGNNEVAPQRFEGAFEPDYIIPFSVTRQQAVERFREHLEGKEYLREGFADGMQVLSVQGAYVPFWLKDGTITFDYTYRCIAKTGGSKNTRYEPRYFRRKGTYDYARVPADASERMADDMMDSIEPYDFSALEPFTPDYLPGFVAERYTVDADEVDRRVYFRMQVASVRAAGKTVKPLYEGPYSEDDRSWTAHDRGREDQVLLPVWLIAVAHEGKKYLVGVNGQTGSVAANLPVNEEKQKAKANRETSKEALLNLCFIVPIAAAFLVVAWRAGTAFMDSLDQIAGGSASMRSQLFSMAFDVAVVAGIAVGAVWGFKWFRSKLEARRDREMQKAAATVQNVKEAAYRAEYDMDCLTITYSAQEQGPLEPPEL